ncbi:MAG: hypothetical protein ACLS3U_05975 [Lachnospiraceae bacterium]
MRIHFKIVMPIVKPALVTAFIMVFQSFWTNTETNLSIQRPRKICLYGISACKW